MPPSSHTRPILDLEGIEKSFTGVQALKGVSFSCLPGETHCLLGENGAGKSTLMRVAAGVWQPDAGAIRVDGRAVALPSPRAAQDLGIAMVYQDTRLVPDIDVSGNIWLGREPGGMLLDRAGMDAGARVILHRLGIDVPLRQPVRDLSVAERQIVEIARALTGEPKVLILDEPTSALDAAEIARLFAIVDELKRAGAAVIFISHRLPEVFAVADRITVMKDGGVVGTVRAAEVDADRLVAMMVGRELATAFPPRAGSLGAVRLAVAGSGSGFRDVAFTARAGEILGLGGIQGNGQSDVVRALFGLQRFDGTIEIDGTPVRPGTPARAIAAGLVYAPGDRHREGLFLPHSIRENVSLPHLPGWSRHGLVPAKRERAAAGDTIARFAVRTPSMEQPVAALSGGNQQKVVLGRWTTGRPRVLVFEDPTRGVDVATKLDIYRMIRGLAQEGATILLVASDLMELIGLSDRILVFSRGRVVDEVNAGEATEARIVGSAVEAGHAPGQSLAGEPAVAAAGDAKRPKQAFPSLLKATFDRLARRYGGATLLGVLLVGLAAVTARLSPYFLGRANLANLIGQIAPLALAALGQLAVILVGGIDLSVGPLISLVTAVVAALAVEDGMGGVGAAVGASLVVGLGAGLANALLIERLKIPDLVATLATYSITLGVALTVRPTPGGSVSDTFIDLMSGSLAGLPWVGFGVVAITLVMEMLLARGRLGQRLYGVGSSAEASHVTGIDVALVRTAAYLFCAVMAALSGLLVAARIGSGDPQAGASFTLASITAVVIGGASIFGGRGTALGTLIGAVTVGLMQNALNLMQVSAYYQYVWTGALTLVAVAGYGLTLPRRRGE